MATFLALFITSNYNPSQPVLSLFRLDNLHEAGKGAVTGSFYLRGKDTGREFIILQVIGDALTALALSGAGFIGAVAAGFVGFNIAFHD